MTSEALQLSQPSSALPRGGDAAGIWRWTSAYTLGLLILSLMFALLFVAIELRVVDPMLRLRVFRSSNVFFTLMTAIVAGISTYTMIAVVPYLYRTPAPVGLGFNTLQTGRVMVPGALMIFLAGLWTGTLLNKWDGKPTLVIGSLALVLGYAAFYTFSSGWLEVTLDQLVVGAGIGFTCSAMAAIIVHLLPREDTGIGSGVYTVMHSLGNVIGPTVTAAYFLTCHVLLPIPSLSGTKMVSFPSSTAFHYIFLASICIAIVGVVTSLLVRRDVCLIEHCVPAEAGATLP
ncbi:MAG: MFS transporter [Halobacteriota archaeon]